MYRFETYDIDGMPAVAVYADNVDVAYIYASEITGVLRIHWHSRDLESTVLSRDELDLLGLTCAALWGMLAAVEVAPEPSERDQLVDHMWRSAGAAISYWVEDVEELKVEEGRVVTPYGNGVVTVTKRGFAAAITKWSKEIGKGHGYAYFDRFAGDWLARRFDRADYDHALADQVFQVAAFGRIIYS